MRDYVVGLLFNQTKTKVVLLEKKHGPPCVVGKWNGVGGKIEDGESPASAMAREFKEEAGQPIGAHNWNHFCTLKSDVHQVHFFAAFVPQFILDGCSAQEDEPVDVFDIHDLPDELMHNIRWMIPFVLDDQVQHDLGLLKLNYTDK